MDATILVNRTHRLPRKAIPQTLVEPEIIFDAPVGDRKRLLAVSAAKGVEALFARGKRKESICAEYPATEATKDRKNSIRRNGGNSRKETKVLYIG